MARNPNILYINMLGKTYQVDRDAWDLTFGTGTDPDVVRADVKEYFSNLILGARIWDEVTGNPFESTEEE